MTTTNKKDEQKSKVRGLFAQEEETLKKTTEKPRDKKPPGKTTKKKLPSREKTEELVNEEEKPKFLTTKQAGRGILHCEIGPELYERAA